MWLIDNYAEDDVLKAEYCREIGGMERAKSILESAEMEDDFHNELAEQIKKRIDEGDTQVFLVD